MITKDAKRTFYCTSLIFSFIPYLFYTLVIKSYTATTIYTNFRNGNVDYLLFSAFVSIVFSFAKTEPRRNSFKLKRLSIVILSIISFVSFNILTFTHFLKNTFGNLEIEQIYYVFSIKTGGTPVKYYVMEYIGSYLPFPIFITIIWMFCIVNTPMSFISFDKNKINIESMPYFLDFVLLTLSLYSIVNITKSRTVSTGDFIEDNYVDPKNVKMEWPEKPRNLIVMFLESMESTFASKEYCGCGKENLIPNLTKLALDPNNVHFSNTEKLGGAYQARLSSWSLAGHLAAWGGIPMKSYMYKTCVDVPYAYTTLEMLEERNYDSYYFVSGEDAYGESALYKAHMKNIEMNFEDKIREYADYKIPRNGVYDHDVYGVALKKLKERENTTKPFMMTVVTIDTHSPYGFACKYCTKTYDVQLCNL